MITFLGDVALLQNSFSATYIPSNPYICNLEYVIDNGLLKPIENKLNMKSSDCDFKKYFGRNPIAVTISNNHILDYGWDGYVNTRRVLQEKGIGIIDANGWEYNESVFLAYSLCGKLNKDIEFSKENFLEKVKQHREKNKLVVVFIHWGIENSPRPEKSQIDLGHWLIDNGADIVVGNHPHCIQPVEIYNEKPIFYSLGNCLFPDHSLDCFYDNNGVARRRWHTRWQKWNRKTISIDFDEVKCKVDAVNYLYMNNKGLIYIKNESLNSFADEKITGLYPFRKYFLFVISNMFIEGKIFEISALSSEIKRKFGKN